MESSSTTAAIAAHALHSSGVRHIFGHPGGEVVDFVEALSRSGVEFVLVGHEATAAFMAGAAGRLTGFPGACLATLGPGACNLVLGVGSAYLDRDPLLAFSARAASDRARVSRKQNLPLNALFEPITKWSVAMDGAATADTIRAALAVARQPPRGPVYLTLPADVATSLDRPSEPGPPSPPAPAPDDAALETIAGALSRARRPIAVVGCALDFDRDTREVRRFLADTGTPYVVLPQAKGVADEDGEMFLGTVAPAAGDAVVAECLRGSDCLLGIGFDAVESSQDWHLGPPVYSLAQWATGYHDYRPVAECTGSVADLLDRLGASYRGGSTWTPPEVAAVRQRAAAAIVPPAASTPAGLSPYHVVRAAREAMPPEAIVTTDVGAHKFVVTAIWRAAEPRTCLVSNGLSAMGYAVAAALAAALLLPQRPVIAIVGDGGFAMMAHELETARRLDLKPLFVVLCDRSLAIIKVAQAKRRLPFRGVHFAPVDWARVAEGFGARGLWASTLAELERALAGWLARPELTVLAVPVDDGLYAGLTY